MIRFLSVGNNEIYVKDSIELSERDKETAVFYLFST